MPLQKPKVSIILSAYCRNREGLLQRAIDSVLAQTEPDWELIALSDGASDGSDQTILNAAKHDPRIRPVIFKENSQLPAKRYNQGMLLARADYVMFLFDDDFFFPNAVEDLYNGIHGTDYGMVYGLADFRRADTDKEFRKDNGANWDLELIKVENYIANLSVIVPKKILHSLGGYDDHPVIKRVCDWDLWIRIGTFYPVKRVRKLIGHVFCQTPNSIESTVCYDRKAIDAYLSTDRELPMIVSLDEPLPELEPLPAHLNSLYPQLRKQISQLRRPKSLPDHPKGKLYMPSRLVMTDFAYRGYLVNFSFRCPTDRLIAIKLFGSTRGQQIKNPAEYRIKVDQQIVAEGILESMINHSWWEIPLENQLTQVKDSLIEITLIHRDKAPFNLLLTESEDAPAIENFTIKPVDAFRWPIFYLRMVRSYIKSYIKRIFKKPGRSIRSGQSPALRILG